MAFKLKRGNNLGSSPHKLIRMGISKRVRKLFGGKHHIPKKGHYDIDRSLFGPVDWDYTWGRIKDFFGSGKGSGIGRKRKKKNGGNFVDQGNDGKGKGRLLPTTIAQYNVGRGGSTRQDDVFAEYKASRKKKRSDTNWMQT